MDASSAVQANVELVKAWLDAHNRQDMRALDFMTDDVEIVEMPTGVVWRGRKDMEMLAKLAYSRKSHKRLTHLIATDTEACAEYVAIVSTSDEVTDYEKQQGLHGVDISQAKPTVDTFELPICFVCHIVEGKIDKAREYWDAASMSRQLGVDAGEEGDTGADGEAAASSGELTPTTILERDVARNLSANPDLVRRVNAICQIDITGPGGGQWYLDLTRQGGVVARGTNPDAVCTIHMSDRDFVAFFTGKLSAQRAYVMRKLRIDGDLATASAVRDILKEQTKPDGAKSSS